MKYEHHPLDVEGRKTLEKRANILGEFRTAPEMLEFIKEKIEKGEDVLITGLGKFELRDKKSRPGRDPKSKRDYVISARRVVTFHPSKVWRDELNNKI